MKKLLIPVFSLLLLSQLLTSCNSDQKELTPNAISDVYIRTKMDNGIKKYALYAYTSASFEMKTVSYTAPSDNTKSIPLASYDNRYVFSNNVDKEPDYSEVMPTKGEYIFTITSTKDVVMERKNILQDRIADIGTITEAIIADGKLNVKWGKVEKSDLYILRLLDKDNKEIYSTNYLSSETIDFSISDRDKYWLIDDGSISNVAKVKLMTILFENPKYFRQNEIQSIGISIFDIVK